MDRILQIGRGWLVLLALCVILAGCRLEASPFATKPAPSTEFATEDRAVPTSTKIALTEPAIGEAAATDLAHPTEEPSVLLSPSYVPASKSPSPTIEPTAKSLATPQPKSSATNTLEPEGTASPTPTLGPKVTRTPAPSEVCPVPMNDPPPILPIDPGTGVVEGFEPQIRAFLNAGGSPEALRAALSELFLTDESGTIWQARAQAVPVDVTGNTTADVVVSLSFAVEGQYAEGALLVYSCQEGEYEGGEVIPLGGQLFSIGGPDPGFRAIQDMNANGVPEIVVSHIEVIGIHGNFTRLFRVLEWDGSQFVDLVQSDAGQGNAAPVQNGDGAVFDTNGNRNQELVLTNGPGQGYADGGPQRERTDLWAWNGYVFRLFSSEFEAPIYRFQAVQDGDDKALVGKYKEALDFYDQVISDDELAGWSEGQLWPDTAYGDTAIPTPDPNERSRLSAYALYRTMLVRVVTGGFEDAQAVYDALQEQSPEGVPGHQYARLAEVFWSEYIARSDVGQACTKTAEYASDNPDEILAHLGSSFYGYLNRDYEAQDVCPFED